MVAVKGIQTATTIILQVALMAIIQIGIVPICFAMFLPRYSRQYLINSIQIKLKNYSDLFSSLFYQKIPHKGSQIFLQITSQNCLDYKFILNFVE